MMVIFCVKKCIQISIRYALLSIIISVFFHSSIYAATYYVDNTCGNNGDGSQQTCAGAPGGAGPFNSIANMRAKAGGYTGGDSILLKKGLTFSEQCQFTWSGSSGNPITISSYGSGTNPLLSTNSSYTLYLNGASHIIVDGVDAQTTLAGAVALRIAGIVDNIRIQNLTLTSTQYGMYAQGDTSNLTITAVTSTTTGSSYAIYVFGTTNSNITISNITTTQGVIRVKNTSNISISNITGTNTGAMAQGVALVQVESSSGTLLIDTVNSTVNALGGVIKIIGSAYTAGNASIRNITHVGDGISNSLTGIIIDSSSYIDVSNFSIGYTGSHGVIAQNGSHHVTFTDGVAEYNLGDGMDTVDTVHDVTFTRCIARYNGTKSEKPPQGSGDGFSTHDTNYNINFLYCQAHNNTNTALALWGQSTGYIYNFIGYNNGGDWTSYGGGPSQRGGLSIPTSSVNPTTGSVFTIKNSIFKDNYPVEIYTNNSNAWFTNTTSDYNIYDPIDDSKFYTYSADISTYYSWTRYHITDNREPHSVNIDPVFITAGSDFRLQPSSPAINFGVDVSQTRDYTGTSVPQGTTPDAGGYEFTLPSTPTSLTQYATNGTTLIATGGTSSETGITVTMTMSSLNASDILTPQVEIREVGTDFSNNATHTGSSITYAGSPVTGTVQITGLSWGKTYHWQSRTSNAAGQSNWSSYGSNAETATDVYIYETTPPTAPTLLSPGGYSNGNTNPTLIFKKSIDSGSGISSYTVTLDSGKNRSFSTTGIPPSGSNISNFIWKDDSTVKITFVNEHDSDTTNDEIHVYFKDLQTMELSEGKHTWSVIVKDNLGNEYKHTNDFYIDKTVPLFNFILLDRATYIIPEVTYYLKKTNRMPIFTGSVKDSYQGSTTVKDVFDPIASGPKTITITLVKLKNEYKSTLLDSSYAPYLQKTFPLVITEDKNNVKTAFFAIAPPFPLQDGYYKATLTVADEAGNKTIKPPFYISINSRYNYSVLLKNVLGLSTDTEIINQEIVAIEQSTDSQNENNTYTVTVKVVDKNNQAITGARVTIHSKKQEGTTNEQGVIQFMQVEPGIHTIDISYKNQQGKQRIELNGQVQEFKYTIAINPQHKTPSWIAYSIGGLLLLIIIMSILHLKKRRLQPHHGAIEK